MSDKSVVSRALAPSKDLNPNRIKVSNIVDFDGRIGINIVLDSGEVLKIDPIYGCSFVRLSDTTMWVSTRKLKKVQTTTI